MDFLSNTTNQENQFDDIKIITDEGLEMWSARKLAKILEYVEFRNFLPVIDKAKTASKKSGQTISNHFVDVHEMVDIGSGATRNFPDILLTRYACYLIVQNADPSKTIVALGQTYFAQQTRRQELSQQLRADVERIAARDKLRQTEYLFSREVMSRNVDNKGMQEIRSSGDTKLFGGRSTREMKERYGITTKKPLADHLPTVTLKAKDLAAEMTTHNTRIKNLDGKHTIKSEHDANNEEVRKGLVARKIIPETLEPCEDVNKVESRLRKQHKLKGKANGDINKLPDPNQDQLL